MLNKEQKWRQFSSYQPFNKEEEHEEIFTVFMRGMLVLGMVGSASAVVLTFDDIGLGNEIEIYDGYGGLNWDNMYYLNGHDSLYQNTGYDKGTVSGDYVAYNAWGDVAAVNDGAFDFNGAYLTGAWNDGLNIKLTGYLNGAQMYTQTVTVDTTGPTWFDFNFFNIDMLSFENWGGTNVGLGGSGTHFAMDNFTYNESAPVPEPFTILLMGLGLIGMAGYGRKRFSKKG